MSNSGIAIDKDTFTVYLMGRETIVDLMTSTNANSFEMFNKIAIAIVDLHGHRYGALVTDDNRADWSLGTTSEEELELLQSFLREDEKGEVIMTTLPKEIKPATLH